ncbi:MAG: phosphate acyltransferase [Marinilabiliaceae bacterium]
MGLDNKMLRSFYDMARQNPRRVVFSEANHVNMLKAAAQALSEGLCKPILLGNEEKLAKIAAENDIDLTGMEIVNLRHDREEGRRTTFAKIMAEEKGREGATFDEYFEKMYDRNYFGLMMVKTGAADAMITGIYTKNEELVSAAKEIIGIRKGLNHIGAMHILNTKKGTYFMADTLINRHPSADTLIDVAKLTYDTVKFFNHEPVMAMLSYANFGATKEGSPATVHKVVETLHERYPDMVVDGEMQVNFALNRELRDRKFPFSKLVGKDVNALVFPNLSSANTASKLMLEMGVGDILGPIQMGLRKPIHFLDIESSVRDIVNMTAVAVLDAQVQEKRDQME